MIKNLILIILLLTIGCTSNTYITLDTRLGNIQVKKESNIEYIDYTKLLFYIEQGISKGYKQVDISNYTLEEHIIYIVNYYEQQGAYIRESKVFIIPSNSIESIEHELQHFFAYELNLPWECIRLQDHPQGYNLKCEKLN